MKPKGEELVAMFDRYGPNALKVDAFLRALRPLKDWDLVAVANANYTNGNRSELIRFIRDVCALTEQRPTQCAYARCDAESALLGSASEAKAVAALLAGALVLEGFLSRDQRSFFSLFLMNPIVPLRMLYEAYKKEDFAIEAFCEQLSVVDGQNVYVEKCLDLRGQTGECRPDFIVRRKGSPYTVEHTSLNSYKDRELYEHLWEVFFEPLNIKEKIEEAYPTKWINIFIPIDAFRSKKLASNFDFDGFIQDLIEAVGQTPESYNAFKQVEHHLLNTPFPVYVSNGGVDYAGCFVTRIVPTDDPQLESDLENEMLRAIRSKRRKLETARAKGERTVLLLDSTDHALVNERTLAEAFARAAARDETILSGIDNVYILHARRRVVPVKIEDTKYPYLPEFKEYILKQVGI